ncbi:Transcriptional activator of proteases prtT [Colletotrichum spinosum]|uniref:Transcriptional activator of proteases prtT n=1 Tax=Colletotrichum spinosum TaxID=1347390 RepID=A0A4R8PUH9_9PEZI|nr:Transcriptional activator of proteases prtT [Colletotrichum spinosum]
MKRARIDGPDKTPNAAPAPSAQGPAAAQAQVHMPKISRKIRACQECQNRKIKCGIEPGQNQCARCSRLGLQCVVNKSLQTLLDSENEWKTKMEMQLQSLQASMMEVQRALNMPQLVPVQHHHYHHEGGGMSQSPVNLAGSQSSPGTGPSPMRPPDVTAMTRENSPEPTTQDNGEDQAIVSAPMASLFEVTKLRNIRSDPGARVHLPFNRAQEPDFIHQGKFSLQEAEQLFSTFRASLNAYLWGGIALVHDTLAATRLSSPLLTAAILAVTALHAQDEGRAFDTCYPIFLELASQSVFDRYHTLDDVRGLCVGAFFLSDLSWKLSGLAVRIATELNLHQFCAKALNNGSPQYVEHARLWYFLYVCDHHFSIAYGRPPVINEDASIVNHEKFLKLPGITQADDRLHSQVGVFIILSRVFHTFGPDRSRQVGRDEFVQLETFDNELAHWKLKWESRLEVPDRHISKYPAKGVILHYYFARLLLYSVCLRGLNASNPSDQYAVCDERRSFINKAIASASAALELILTDPDMRRAVIGVPLYLLTTIAYAAMFLMKVYTQWKPAKVDIHYDDVVSLIERVVGLLGETSRCTRHVAHYIGRGLNNMLDKFKERGSQEQRYYAAAGQAGQVAGPPGPGQPVPQVWPEELVTNWDTLMFSADPNFGMGPEYQQPYNFLESLHSQMPG